MEKRLKRRFILTAVSAVLILLVMIEAGFYFFSFQQMSRSLDLTLSYIISHADEAETDAAEEAGADSPEAAAAPESGTGLDPGNGTVTETDAGTEADGSTEENSSIILSGGDQETQVRKPVKDETNLLQKLVIGFQDFGDAISGNVEITPESKYRMRYFLITVDANGDVLDSSLSHIAEVNQETAEQLALEHYRFRNNGGLLEYANSWYYYKAVPQEDGSTIVGFLECTQEVRSVDAMRAITVLVCLLVILLFFIILSLLSRRAIAPYVENIKSQKQFITNASHELKTPLAIISANTEAIEMIYGKSEWTDTIIAQVKRSTGLINSMLALARMNEEQKVELALVSLSEVVKESAKSFQTMIDQQQKKLSLDIADEVSVMGDRNLLTELSNILIDNAVKYCDDCGMIRISVRRRGRSGAVLTVSNDYKDGAGKDYNAFFRRFYRGDASHNSKKAGHGIGLSMARSIAEKMKGSISVSWKEGVITFTVNL